MSIFIHPEGDLQEIVDEIRSAFVDGIIDKNIEVKFVLENHSFDQVRTRKKEELDALWVSLEELGIGRCVSHTVDIGAWYNWRFLHGQEEV